MNWLFFVASWLICAVLTCGILTAYFQADGDKDELRENLGLALMLGLATGPLGLVVAFLISGFAKHGLKFW